MHSYLNSLNNLSDDIYLLFFLYAEMAFRNFVVAGGVKEISFIPKDPKDVSAGVGSPFVSVNNNDVDAQLIEPLAYAKPAKHAKPANREENT